MRKMTEAERIAEAIKIFVSKPRPYPMPCGCLGKDKPSDPGCRCEMMYVVEVDGYYYRMFEEIGVNGWQARNIGSVEYFVDKARDPLVKVPEMLGASVTIEIPQGRLDTWKS
jgi:hypothetical protein